MKTICITLIAFTTFLLNPTPNKTVGNVDLKRFSGKWYSLASIPTMFDKGSRETTTEYTLEKDGHYSVVTTCKEGDENKVRTIKSKMFQVEGTNNSQMKAQFMWPFKVDYWIIDLAPDYSYVVVGHPDYKFLFIMSRKPTMDKAKYQEIVARCKSMGYPVEKLTSQQFPGEAL